MAVESFKAKFEFPPKEFILKDSLSKITDKKIIQMILTPLSLSLKNFKRAMHQLEIYFRKISSHPEMRSYYISLIKKLVQYEKDNLKKRECKK
ncbi:hypothetical protein LCGC14_1558760 [marine sediment metagenome]|uniref:Uncharacterized protein n=1 Tax=marine sediment metagenome TaxID=412755 RepID=A0A0F9J970_9ZZZZ